MAMATESLCHNDPNFAVICNFWDRYGEMIGLKEISYADLERWLEDTKQVPMPLIDIHVRLLRRIGKTSVTANRWERYIIKFCYTYSDVDAWEMEKFGYKHCKLTTKLTLLKNLLEKQFDQNSTFKEKINKLAPEDMRFQPIGRDKNGLAYWYMLDNECNLRVYREDQDDNDAETWEIVCKTRSDLAELIGQLEKQIEGSTDVKPEPSSSNDSTKSEPPDNNKLETSEDSQESLPHIKKDPEKNTALKDEKLDEVDGVVAEHKDGEEEKKDIKTEQEIITEEKDENVIEKKISDIGACNDEVKKHFDINNSNTKELVVKCEIIKTEQSDDADSVKIEVKTEILESVVKSGTECSKINVTLRNKDGEVTTCNSKNAGNSDILSEKSSTEKNKQTSSSHASNSPVTQFNENTKNIPETRVSSKDTEKLNEQSVRSQNDNIEKASVVKLETDKKPALENSVEKTTTSNNSAGKCETVSDQKSDILEENNVKIDKELIQNSDTKTATSNLIGAKCDTNDKKLESEDVKDIQCGCDKNGLETNAKGDNQNNHPEIKEIDDYNSENNVRRSSRTRTARTQSQDSKLKDDKSDKSQEAKLENLENSKAENESQTHLNGDIEQENNKTPSKVKNKTDKGKKRPLLFEDNSTEDSPAVEPESKKSKPAKKVLTKKQPAKSKSSSEETDDSDDIPLSQIKGTPKSSGKKTPKSTPKQTPKGKKGKNSEPTPTRKSSRPVKKKKFDSEDDEEEALPKSKKAKGKTDSKKTLSKSAADSEGEDAALKSAKKSQTPEPEVEDEDDGGRRRSSRVKTLRARKKDPTPPPSSFSEEEEEEDDDDHSEFSLDTDIDDSDDEYNPAPKGRNAQRRAAIEEQEQTVEIPNDTPCLHCQKTDRPEWLLLCDKCDDGYHTACLRPPLMIIPDGDWFCPPCEHKLLLEKLQASLKELDTIMKKKDRLIKRKERLAFVGISLDNILKDEHKENVNPVDYEQYSGDDQEECYKPKPKKSFVKRSCRSRNVISYKFDEFDEMINTAIKEDLENPQPYNPGKGRSRGKDMANIYMAEGREYVSENEGKPSPVGGTRKKKGRRLTNLDSDDLADEDSGDEYRCSEDSISEPPEEEEEDDDDISDYSADGEGWGPRGTRRSARRRNTRRYRDFVVDDEEDSDFAPRRKSARATRAATRQRRKYKEVWSDEEEEELEEETEESVDTEDLCSEDSGPTKKKKDRKEIDRKVLGGKKNKKDKSGAKKRRISDSEDGSESSDKSSGKDEESESKSESDDSSVDIGKIKKAAKRKLAKSRYSESSSESEKSDSRPTRHTRRSAAKKVNYKAIAGTDSDSTEVSEEKSESEKDKKSKRKNVIRDDSTDTDDYYDKKSGDHNEKGETTEEDEKEPIKPKKQKKKDEETVSEEESKSVENVAEKSPEKTAEQEEVLPAVNKDDNSKPETETGTESKSETSIKEDDLFLKEPEIANNDSTSSDLLSENQPEAAVQNLSMLQNSTGVIRPSPQYSMGRNLPEGSFSSQHGQHQFQSRSPPYGSPPQRQYMSSPPHQPYHTQSGHVMRPVPPHSQPYPSNSQQYPTNSQQYPPQMMHGNFPVSSSGQPMPQMSANQVTISSPPFSQMQQRPQYSSNEPVPQSQAQMFGRSPQGQPIMRGPHPSQQDSRPIIQGPNPDMSGPPRGSFSQQNDGQMMRGPFPNQQQMMHGPYSSQQQMMMMQGGPNYQQSPIIRGPHPNQMDSHTMRSQYPHTNQTDLQRGSHPGQENPIRGPHPGQQDGGMKSPDMPSSQSSMMQGPYPGYQSRPIMQSPYPGQPERPVFRGPFQGQPERMMMTRGHDYMYRPGFSTPDQQMQSSHPNQQTIPNKPAQSGPRMTPPEVLGSHITKSNIASPTMNEFPVKNKIESDKQEKWSSDDEVAKKESANIKEKGQSRQDSTNNSKNILTHEKDTIDIRSGLKQEKESDKITHSEQKEKDVSLDAKKTFSEALRKSSIETPPDTDVVRTQEQQSNVVTESESSVKVTKKSTAKKQRKKPDGETVADLLSEKGPKKQETVQNSEKGESVVSGEKADKELISGSHIAQKNVPNLHSPPPHIPPESSVLPGPVPGQPDGSMVSGPHPYQQGMFRGQFNEMMSQMGQSNVQRLPYHQSGMDLSHRSNMQGPQNFNQISSGPRNYMPGVRPEVMGPMQPNFQRPMYGPGPAPYPQMHRMPNSYGPRPEMGMRMPHSFRPDENRTEGPNKSQLPEVQTSQSPVGSEPTKSKKPRKPRQTKQQKEKQQVESKTVSTTSSTSSFPVQGFPHQPQNIGPIQQFPMPMSGPMNPQQGHYMRPPFDNFGMNGLNQGPPEYNQVNPGMYGPPQMLPGNGGRGFMIDNLLDKQPRVQQLEPIISQDDEEESVDEAEQPQIYGEEPSPSNGEKDMDEMSDIGDIVKYVMNH